MRAALPLFLLLAALAAAGEPELTVELRSGAGVSGGLVRLDEVADLAGPLAGRAAAVLLGAAPEPGGRLVLSRGRVAQRLQQEGFAPEQVRLAGAHEAVVGRAVVSGRPAAEPRESAAGKPGAADRERTEKLYVDWIRMALAERLGCPADVLDIRLNGALRGALPAAAEGAEGRVLWPSGALRLGRMRLPVEVLRGGERVATLEGTVEAAARLRVLVAARNVSRDELLLPDDVREAELLLTDLGGRYVQAAESLAGMCAARELRAGDPLEAGALRRQKLVSRGQPVLVISESGAVRVSERGVARGEGGLGDPVAIDLPGSRAQVMATVTGNGQVRVE
jgi:flagella basal body P-ring formation protein FlgA